MSWLRQLDDAEPVLVDGFHHADESLEGDRLCDEGARAEVVTAAHVFILVGRGHDDDRNLSKGGVGLNLGKRSQAILLRHREIEQNETGPGCGALGAERTATIEVMHQFLSVADSVQTANDAASDERVAHEQAVVRVIVREKNSHPVWRRRS